MMAVRLLGMHRLHRASGGDGPTARPGGEPSRYSCHRHAQHRQLRMLLSRLVLTAVVTPRPAFGADRWNPPPCNGGP